MKKNGLGRPYAIFVRDMVFPGRHTTSGRTDTSRKESRDYQTFLEVLKLDLNDVRILLCVTTSDSVFGYSMTVRSDPEIGGEIEPC